MIIDKALQLSAAQAVTASAASTSYIDQLAKGDSYDQLFIDFIVGTAFATSTSATLQITIQSADDAAFTTNLTTHVMSTAFAASALTANTEIIKMQLPYGLRRYIRAYYTVGTGTFTAGTISADIVWDVRMA